MGFWAPLDDDDDDATEQLRAVKLPRRGSPEDLLCNCPRERGKGRGQWMHVVAFPRQRTRPYGKTYRYDCRYHCLTIEPRKCYNYKANTFVPDLPGWPTRVTTDRDRSTSHARINAVLDVPFTNYVNSSSLPRQRCRCVKELTGGISTIK